MASAMGTMYQLIVEMEDMRQQDREKTEQLGELVVRRSERPKPEREKVQQYRAERKRVSQPDWNAHN